MKKAFYLFALLFLIVPFVHGEQSCNDLIKSFFFNSNKSDIKYSIVTSVQDKYPDSQISSIIDKVANEITKEMVCSQAEDKTTKTITKTLAAFKNEIDDYPKKKNEYVRFIGKIIKKSCKKIDE